MKIIISDRAKKDLQKIKEGDRVTAQRISDKINPDSFDLKNMDIRPLINSNNLYRLRVGNYRIIFTISDNIVIITKIRHRQGVYDD